MKAFKITPVAAIACGYFAVLSAVSCCQCPEMPKDKPQKQIVVIESQKSIDYDALCIVGNRYTIYGIKWDEDNPFEKQPMDDVVISAKKNGFVQYYSHKDRERPCYFTRSCKEFVESLNRR